MLRKIDALGAPKSDLVSACAQLQAMAMENSTTTTIVLQMQPADDAKTGAMTVTRRIEPVSGCIMVLRLVCRADIPEAQSNEE